MTASASEAIRAPCILPASLIFPFQCLIDSNASFFYSFIPYPLTFLLLSAYPCSPSYPHTHPTPKITPRPKTLHSVYTSHTAHIPNMPETASPTTPAPTSAQPPASSSANIDDSDGLGDMSAFPDISSGGAGGAVGNSNVRVTGAAGLGEDEDREKFESSFPDLSGEVGYESVSLLI